MSSADEIQAAAKAINKTINMFENSFELEVPQFKNYPSKRRLVFIELLKQKIEEEEIELNRNLQENIDEMYEEIDEFTRKTVIQWYRIGARRGAIEMLKYLNNNDHIAWVEYEEVIKEEFEKLEWVVKKLKYKKFDNESDSLEEKKFKIFSRKILKKTDKEFYK